MNVEEFREYCLLKKGVTEEFPFDLETLVFKVGGKIFALTGLEHPVFAVNLKCNPDYAEELRASYSEISSAYHMSKKHWNTVNFEGCLTDEFLKSLIDHSYDLVVQKLPKNLREKLL